LAALAVPAPITKLTMKASKTLNIDTDLLIFLLLP
jgi:hypothetical protein